MKIPSCLMLFSFSVLFCGRALAAPPVPPDFQEDWYIVTMQNRPCGYMHAILKRVGDQVHASSRTKIEIRRGSTLLSITVDQSSRETLEGKPLGFKNVSALGAVPETLTGIIEGDKLKLITEQFGTKHENVYPFDPDVRFAWGQYLIQRERGLEPGTTYTIKTYDPGLKKDGPVKMIVEVRGPETIDVLGKQRELHRMAMTMKLGGIDIVSDIWVDDELNPIVTTLNLGFMKMRIQKTSKEEALKKGAPPEMFLQTMVPVAKAIGPGAKRVRLRLRIKDGVEADLPTFPNTRMQSFKRIGDREAIVTIRRDDWQKARRVARNDRHSPAMAPFLKASIVCDNDDKKIKRLARRASRGSKQPAAVADALRKFVTDYITDKSMEVGFATASEVARNRAGDCTEHGVLLAALARASGLPARGVSGIVEVPRGAYETGNDSAFGYHMWTQVYIGDRWYDIDAALRQTDCEPNRVAVGIIPLGEEGMVNSITSLIPLLGQLEIEVLDIQR